MKYLIEHAPTKMHLEAHSLDELIEKLKYLNPMFLKIAQQCLMKKYKLLVEDSGDKVSIKPLHSPVVDVVFISKEQDIISKKTSSNPNA